MCAEKRGRGRGGCWVVKNRAHILISLNLLFFLVRARAHHHIHTTPHHTTPYQQIFVISFPLLPEDKRKDKRHLFFIFCFLLSSLREHWQQHSERVRVRVRERERRLRVEPIRNLNRKLYGVIHALCEISYYRNVADALYTHFFLSLSLPP